MSRGLMLTRQAAKAPARVVSAERMYEIVRAPLITEKATMGQEFNQYSFNVSIDASKPEIKAAVEELFSVKVRAVNTSILKGKVKRFRGHKGKRNDTKKAVVRLQDGYQIDLSTGL
jgi:large subunit ribosomal protein L23